MIEYPKIQTVFKRDERGKLLVGQYSLPEFEYLKDNRWLFTEKVDGTNIRIMWNGIGGMKIGGKTDNAQIPTFLYDKLREMFPVEKLQEVFGSDMVCLYGEGYGAKIQKGGGNYIHDGVSFVLFDVKVDKWWLKAEDIADIGSKLSVLTVPIIGVGNLDEMITMASNGFASRWGTFTAEGIVARPTVDLVCRNGHRVITKIKYKDFLMGRMNNE